MSEKVDKVVNLLNQIEGIFYNTKKQYIGLVESHGQLLEGELKGNTIMETIHVVMKRLYPPFKDVQIELFKLTHERVPQLQEKAWDSEILNKYCTCGGCYVDSSGTYAQCNEGRIALKKLGVGK